MIFHADGCGVYGGPMGCDCGAADTKDELARLRKQVADLEARLKFVNNHLFARELKGIHLLATVSEAHIPPVNAALNLKLKSWRKGGK